MGLDHLQRRPSKMAKIKGIKIDEPRRRLRGGLPKTGIRPAIDGRRKGIREALEGQTMGMARAAADFLAKNLRHPNGLPVECVIADTRSEEHTSELQSRQYLV